ncbi:MAG: hypothetical protein QOI47_814, partial [Actinomycetota bacterium]|nr:hypothetical protein [Actinomycetota bacterium]
GVVIRQTDLPAVALVSARIWIAAPALALFLRTTQRDRARDWRLTPRLALNGVVLAAHWVSFIAALQRAPIGTVLLITYLAPVGIAALAPAVLGEVVATRTKIALGLAVVGIALIALPQVDGASRDGIALAFVTGLLYVGLALSNKKLSDEHGGVHLALWQLLVAGSVLLPFSLVSDWGAAGADWGWLLVLGLVYTAFAFGAYLTALAHLPATRAAVLLYMEPASAVLFGWLLLDERPTWATLAGGMLVVGAGVLVVRVPVAADGPPIHLGVTDAVG